MKTFSRPIFPELVVGNEVIFDRAPTENEEWSPAWPHSMDAFIGSILTVRQIRLQSLRPESLRNSIFVDETNYIFPVYLARVIR